MRVETAFDGLRLAAVEVWFVSMILGCFCEFVLFVAFVECEMATKLVPPGRNRNGTAPALAKPATATTFIPNSEVELAGRAAGSARRWRAVFGGSPKTSYHSLFRAAKKVRTGTRGIGRAAQSCTRAACAPHFYFGVRVYSDGLSRRDGGAPTAWIRFSRRGVRTRCTTREFSRPSLRRTPRRLHAGLRTHCVRSL